MYYGARVGWAHADSPPSGHSFCRPFTRKLIIPSLPLSWAVVHVMICRFAIFRSVYSTGVALPARLSTWSSLASSSGSGSKADGFFSMLPLLSESSSSFAAVPKQPIKSLPSSSSVQSFSSILFQTLGIFPGSITEFRNLQPTHGRSWCH